MNWSKVAEILRTAPESIDQSLTKAWIKHESAEGVRVYVRQPGKTGTCRMVEVSGAGYGPTFGGVELPAFIDRDVDNGLVAFAYDMDKDGGVLLQKLLAALPTVKAEPSPKGRRTRASGPAIDVAADLGLE